MSNTSSTPSTSTTRDVVILGSGVSGLTAAIYTARANLKPLVIEGHEPGGQLSITTLVENFPGWPEGIQGPELIENIKKQATRFGAELKMAHLNSIDLTKRPYTLNLGKEIVHARTVIIASGASARWLNLPSEQALIGYGVSSCATCDGFFFSGKEIAVIGGGDSAMEEALFLTRFASKVTLINRSEHFRASKIMLERAMAHPQIKFMSSTIVEEVLGVDEKEVKGLRLKNKVTGDESTLPVSGMFLGIGHEPNARAFTGMIDLDDDGYIKTTNNVFVTKDGEIVPGVFACGDIQDRRPDDTEDEADRREAGEPPTGASERIDPHRQGRRESRAENGEGQEEYGGQSDLRHVDVADAGGAALPDHHAPADPPGCLAGEAPTEGPVTAR